MAQRWTAAPQLQHLQHQDIQDSHKQLPAGTLALKIHLGSSICTHAHRSSVSGPTLLSTFHEDRLEVMEGERGIQPHCVEKKKTHE